MPQMIGTEVNHMLTSLRETRDFNGDGFMDTLVGQSSGIGGNWTTTFTDGRTGQVRSGSMTWTVGNGGAKSGFFNVDMNGDGGPDRYFFTLQSPWPGNGNGQVTYNNINTTPIQWSGGGIGPIVQSQNMTGTFINGWAGGVMTVRQKRDFNFDGFVDELIASSSNTSFGNWQSMTATLRDGRTGQMRYGTLNWNNQQYTSGQFYIDLNGDGLQDTLAINEINRIQQGNGYISTYSAQQSNVWQQQTWPNWWPPYWNYNQWPWCNWFQWPYF